MFVLLNELQRDTVTDYLDETDLFDMRQQDGAANFRQLRFTDTEEGVVIDYKAGSILVLGAFKADMDQGDFLF
jgi:hypothetical protein